MSAGGAVRKEVVVVSIIVRTRGGVLTLHAYTRWGWEYWMQREWWVWIWWMGDETGVGCCEIDGIEGGVREFAWLGGIVWYARVCMYIGCRSRILMLMLQWID